MPHPVRVVRVARGKSLRALASAAKLDPAVLSRIENGLSPSREHIEKLARGLRVKADNLQRAITLATK